MDDTYRVHCDCGAVGVTLSGEPKVRGHCHCDDCRNLLDVPYHSVTAWDAEQFEITRGAENLTSFQHPRLAMRRVFCSQCGEVVYNTNAKDWRVVSQHLIAKSYDGTLPEALEAQSHFHYGSRIIDVIDGLDKKTD